MLLGSYSVQKKTFPHVVEEIKKLKSISHRREIEKSDEVNRTLLEMIQKEEEPCFLLAPVLDFIERVDKEGLLEHYTFNSFELWLNQASDLSAEENLHIRGKIAGKWIDRSDYQVFFPIGMGKTFEGTHFVTAHKSPDLDTTIASFWGWVDAFAARVGNSLHVWNLPGGPPSSQIEIQWIFSDVFGPSVFTHLPKLRNALNLTGLDLMSKSGMALKTLEDSIGEADHEDGQSALVIVDSEGFYLGDWRSLDAEEVRQVIILLSSCLRWFENHLHLHLISLFAKEKPQLDSIQTALKELFLMPLKNCEPAKEYNPRQKREVSQFITVVLQAEEGLDITFEKLGIELGRLSSVPFRGLDQLLEVIAGLFGSRGELIEDRPKIFTFLEVVIRKLHEAILKIRIRLEKLDIALKTKERVFDRYPTFVSLRSDVEEIRQKMGSRVSLTVATSDHEKRSPVGTVYAQDLRKQVLGTVSLRDFCNREEMTIPSYLDIISVIDHHKSQLQTSAPPFAVIADAQSSNTLVARQAFEINDRYSFGRQEKEEIEKQIRVEINESSPSSSRVLQRLLKKRNLASAKTGHFIHSDREFLEYLHFLYGILDDTDLLSKVSALDIECVASLLNRMKSLVMKKEVEIIALDEISRDKYFPKKAAQKILQNEDMYSLYSKVYAHREGEVAESIVLAGAHKPSNFFADTKIQNGCCRVGQTKIFASSVAIFSSYAEAIQKFWVGESQRIQKEKPEIDLHIHMVSTIVSAEEVYKGTTGTYPHKDEMWIWIPSHETGIEHLKQFLNSFQTSPGLKNNPIEVEFLGPLAKEYQDIFKESFLDIPSAVIHKEISFVILRYKAGSLNSRKAMISPFLPKAN